MRVNGELPAGGQLEPFVGDDDDGLRQIERGEARIDRQRENAVRKRDLVILEPVALAAEHEGDCFAPCNPRRHLRRRLRRADDRLGLVVSPGRGGNHKAAIGERAFDAVE